MLASPELQDKLERLQLITIGEKPKHIYHISVLDIISAIYKILPGCNVINLGETDTVIICSVSQRKENAFLKLLKVCVLSLVLAVGAATAIMSFHNDSEIPRVFSAYHKMFTGEETNKPRVIQISYAIGVGSGIIIFFNHFAGRKITADPSPIEVEMSKYDESITNTLIDLAKAEKDACEGGGKHNTA